MLKVVFAVVLAIAQAPFPMPGQALGSSGKASDNIQAQSHENKETPTQPVAAGKSNQPPSQNAHGGQQADDDKEQSIKLTQLPPISIAKEQKGWIDHAFDWGPWVFNLLLVVVGGLQVWLLAVTWKAITRQANEMRRQRHEMRRQTVHLGRQAHLMEDTAKRQLRAYLCIDEAALKITSNENGGQPNVGLEGQLHLKNGGQTPAYRVRSWVHGSIGIYPDNIPIAPPPEGLPRGEGIVPAQGKSIIAAQEIKVFPQVMENLRNTANVAYYVQGEVRYQDIFKDWHRLKIRLFYGGATGGRTTKDSKGVTVGFLLPDSWGNCEEDIQCDDEGNPI